MSGTASSPIRLSPSPVPGVAYMPPRNDVTRLDIADSDDEDFLPPARFRRHLGPATPPPAPVAMYPPPAPIKLQRQDGVDDSDGEVVLSYVNSQGILCMELCD